MSRLARSRQLTFSLAIAPQPIIIMFEDVLGGTIARLGLRSLLAICQMRAPVDSPVEAQPIVSLQDNRQSPKIRFNASAKIIPRTGREPEANLLPIRTVKPTKPIRWINSFRRVLRSYCRRDWRLEFTHRRPGWLRRRRRITRSPPVGT